MKDNSKIVISFLCSGILRLTVLFLIFNFPLIAGAQESGDEKFWVFFQDRRGQVLNKINKSASQQSQYLKTRSLERRKKVMPDNRLVLEGDLPVEADYIKDLINHGFHPIQTSRWLHAVSLNLSQTGRRWIESRPYVSRVQPVAVYRKRIPNPESNISPPGKRMASPFDLEYGPSLFQNEMIRTPEVHRLGFTGAGILIGIMDTGFNRSHEALEEVEVVSERDFINGDDNTANEPGDPPGQDKHGSQVLSTVGGFREGQLIGTAFGARFALAKVEIVDREITIEEDNWVAGIEWLENLGVDVVNSSLGYADRFEDRPNYTFDQMDGKTAITTVAAQAAAERGVVMVNSVGNERQDFWGHLIAPSDAPGVIAVGAVSATGLLSSFSSPGPTADDRIKPDCVALGEGVLGVRYNLIGNPVINGYSPLSGTSFSSPMVAGVAALLLEANPLLTPEEIMETLHQTSDRSRQPDNDYGYGLVDAYRALLHHGPVFNSLEVEDSGTNYRISLFADAQGGIQNGGMELKYQLSGETNSYESIVMNAGSEPNLFVGEIPATSLLDDSVRFYFSVTTGDGENGRWPGGNGTFNRPLIQEIPEQFSLMQNFPNPFNENTRFIVLLPENAFVTLKIYSILGKEVRTLAARRLTEGKHFFEWDGRNAQGVSVASGVYFYRLKTSKFTRSKRMLYLR